jgi:glutaredoxin
VIGIFNIFYIYNVIKDITSQNISHFRVEKSRSMKSKELSISKLKKNISTKMHPIVIYALPNCPYCKSALELLDTHKIKYNKMIVENEKKEEYKKICSMETFPMIFIQRNDAPEKYIKIGGFSD